MEKISYDKEKLEFNDNQYKNLINQLKLYDSDKDEPEFKYEIDLYMDHVYPNVDIYPKCSECKESCKHVIFFNTDHGYINLCQNCLRLALRQLND